MPRKKSTPGLPEYVSIEHGTYYFRVGKEPRIRLGRTYIEAMQAHARLLSQHAGLSGWTMEALFDRYVAEELSKKAEATQATNLQELKMLRAFFKEYAPEEVTPVVIYAYMDARSAARANRELSLLSVIFKKGIRWGACTTNPCRDIERNAEHSRDRCPSEHEVFQFLQYAPRWLALYVDFKYVSGWRQKDILELKVSAFDDEGIEVTPSKSKRWRPGRAVRVGRKYKLLWTDDLKVLTESILALWPGRTATYLFENSKGGPYNKNSFHSVWQRAMQKFVAAGGERFWEHDMRARTASDDREGAQARLSHLNVTTTDIYLRSKELREITPLKTKFSRRST